jgi:hypothetical protein
MLALTQEKQGFLNNLFSGTLIDDKICYKPQIPFFLMQNPVLQAP